MGELGLADTNGILALPWVRPDRTSAGLGWDRVYVSRQRERPYRAEFGAARSHQLILHLDGPVTVRRGVGTSREQSRRMPAGGLFLQPSHAELSVELGGELDTVHVYVDDDAVQEAAGEPVRLAEELGSHDPLLEQLVLGLDGVVRDWEPAARTYADQLGSLVAAQLVRHHRAGHVPEAEPARGLSDRQFARVRDLMAERLAEPVPLADLAALAGLSVSQFSRRFKARTGLPPHRYLLRLRVEQAGLLLRTGDDPIAEIAVRCGFSHQEHLTRVLRAQLGTTPAAVRRAG
ncbi:helix-turn-helix domain-containing protein [Amycolatopsis vancoresmycina]|uniref:AraC family transcriptional regulator n=1 Tax=Amycolatopsis vancoresmycina DSM 44592 TaxID=1292037 RepID=R1I0M8_9PSEU|nr:AraC family transcriptional regulator [Amycolatopsis vancoresmycina]EOD69380.1 AraC family transcriptional regulator [Amycolatopsis vancoresmycina DSM 44592]